MNISIKVKNWVRIKEDEDKDIIFTFLDGDCHVIDIYFDEDSKYLYKFIKDIKKQLEKKDEFK